jgi:hypothetical protein
VYLHAFLTSTKIELSCQIHAPSLYTRGNKPQVPTPQETGWAPEPVWTLWRNFLPLPVMKLRFLGRPALYSLRYPTDKNTHYLTHDIKRQVFIMETQWIFCEVKTKFLKRCLNDLIRRRKADVQPVWMKLCWDVYTLALKTSLMFTMQFWMNCIRKSTTQTSASSVLHSDRCWPLNCEVRVERGYHNIHIFHKSKRMNDKNFTIIKHQMTVKNNTLIFTLPQYDQHSHTE